MSKFSAKPLAVASSLLLLGVVGAALAPTTPAKSSGALPPDPISGQNFPDESGTFRTVSVTGRVDQTNPFFKSLGSNGRACVTCHQPTSGWTITPTSAQAVFDATGGLDPLFRTVDGANSPQADVSTLAARTQAYSMLLTRGVINIHLPIPAGAEFTLKAVDDPYGYAGASALSLFRRPLPTTNMPFLNVVMWDGRQNSGRPNRHRRSAVPGGGCDPDPRTGDDRTGTVHEDAAVHRPARDKPVHHADLRYERRTTGRRRRDGRPGLLSHQGYFSGINDPFGFNPSGRAFSPNVFRDVHGLAHESRRSASARQTAGAARAARQRRHSGVPRLSGARRGVVQQ